MSISNLVVQPRPHLAAQLVFPVIFPISVNNNPVPPVGVKSYILASSFIPFFLLHFNSQLISKTYWLYLQSTFQIWPHLTSIHLKFISHKHQSQISHSSINTFPKQETSSTLWMVHRKCRWYHHNGGSTALGIQRLRAPLWQMHVTLGQPTSLHLFHISSIVLIHLPHCVLFIHGSLVNKWSFKGMDHSDGTEVGA